MDHSFSQLPSQPTGDTDTSPSLLEGLRRQQSDKWELFVRIYAPLVLEWCRRKGLASHEAADITQDVFLKVWSYIANFVREPPKLLFRRWLYTITLNRIRDHYRRRGNQMPCSGGSSMLQLLQQVPEPEDDDSAERELAETRPLLIRQIAEQVQLEFESRTWQAFWRTVVDGADGKDAARELAMSPGAIRQAKYKVLRRFRQLVGELDE